MNDDYKNSKKPAKKPNDCAGKRDKFLWIQNKQMLTILVEVHKNTRKTDVLRLCKCMANIWAFRNVSSASFISWWLTNMCILSWKTSPWAAELSFQLQKLYGWALFIATPSELVRLLRKISRVYPTWLLYWCNFKRNCGIIKDWQLKLPALVVDDLCHWVDISPMLITAFDGLFSFDRAHRWNTCQRTVVPPPWCLANQTMLSVNSSLLSSTKTRK